MGRGALHLELGRVQHDLLPLAFDADRDVHLAAEAAGFEVGALDAAVLGISVDDVETHRAWAAELGGVAFPLLSDKSGDVCRAYGVLNDAEQRAWRGTVVVSSGGTVAYQVVSPMNVGRSV